MGQSGRGLRATKKGEDDDDDDVKKQIDSDNKNVRQIYRLVNVKNGGGKLIDIIKSTARVSGSESFMQTSIGVAGGDRGRGRGGGGSRSRSSTSKSSEFYEREQSAVDKQIYELVEPLLYNGGKGKLVPLSRTWLSRMNMSKKIINQDDDDDDEQEIAEMMENSGSAVANYRWVCWKLEERGFVGETALHICFLLSTPTHMILAKKLLALFPMLINDIYTCDEYFGESSLHMAIVNEDIRIVKLLLDHKANVHERCLGSFFLPIDQKERANDSIRTVLENQTKRQLAMAQLDQFDLKSNQLHGLTATNYDGYAYWGEFPLSFAACLGLTDCYKILLAKGADPNRQDSNGNATLHMTVIADRIDMFDLCYSNGADLTILNKQNLNPLTLAAKLKRVDMFFHILTIQRQVNWIFCNVGFAETPLAGIDSIDERDGSCDMNSALSIVVFGASSEHLRMLDGLLAQLLAIKWTTAARNRFRLWLGQFFLFMLLSMIAYWSRFKVRKVAAATTTTNLAGSDADENQSIWSSYHHLLSSLNWDQYSELALILFVIYYLWVIMSRIVPQFSSTNSIISSISQAPEISLFSITCLLILTCIPLRLFDWKEAEDIVASLVMFSLPLKFLFFCRASKSVGPFVVVIYKIVANDVLNFIVLLVIFVGGFSQSLQIIFKSHQAITPSNGTTTTSNEFGDDLASQQSKIDRNYFNHVLDGILSMHMMAFNEFGFVFDEFDSTDYPIIARLLFLIYMILVSILLVNMIIAMLGKTYQDIASQPNENLRQWARALLIVERMWTKRERLEILDKYSHKQLDMQTSELSNSERKFGLTWTLSEKDLGDIELSKRLKADNLRYAARLKRVRDNQVESKQIAGLE